MKRIIALAILALASVGSAHAGEVETGYRVDCYNNSYGHGCKYSPVFSRSLTVTPEESAERDERIAAWESFCKPTPVEDKFGVTRLTYAHKNCDFGRTR